jgi:hypothetical protein
VVRNQTSEQRSNVALQLEEQRRRLTEVMRSMLAADYTAGQYLQYCLQSIPLEEQGALQGKVFMRMPGKPVPEL